MSSQLDHSDGVILEAQNILRLYPGNVALNRITYKVHRGRVNVLIGENGAGKSTLMRILSGVEQPDEGKLFLNGQAIQPRSPREAARLGIAIVHQELSVFHDMTVSDNIFAGRELTRGVLLDIPAQDVKSAQALRQLRQRISERTRAGSLSLGARQLVELARSLSHSASVLILDEPTSALSSAETGALFHVLEDLKSAGVTIIYISHRLQELLHLGDHFTVLRSGNIVGEGRRGEVTRQWIVERMTGGLRSEETTAHHRQQGEQEALRVTGVSLAGATSTTESNSSLHGVSFGLRKGELLGFYGLLGAGRTELLEVLAGARQPDAGTIQLEGQKLRLASIGEAISAGISLVPEDRQRDGLVQSLSVRENIALSGGDRLVLSKTRETAQMRELADSLNLVPRNLELPVSALSGGNQQKVLIARCLMRSPKVLLLDEPTRGVDVGARTEIYKTLRNLAAQGLSIIFTSSEVEETRLLADRVLVLCQGRIAAEIPRGQITDESLFTAASPQLQDSASSEAAEVIA